MSLGHIMGLPIEESLSQLVPAGAAMLTVAAVAARAALARLGRPLRHEDRRREDGP